MIYLFVIVCIVVYILSPCNTALGVSTTALQGAFLYQFSHANVLHLCINMLSLLIMYIPICKIYCTRFNVHYPATFFVICYLGSVLAALFTATDVPTIGASGMVFFLLGALLMLRPTRRQLRSMIYVAIAVLISIFFGNSNEALHVLSFVFGCVFIIIRIAYDNRRVKDSE